MTQPPDSEEKRINKSNTGKSSKKFKGKRLAGETSALKPRELNAELESPAKTNESKSLKRPNQS
jgi:hypothetical protein